MIDAPAPPLATLAPPSPAQRAEMAMGAMGLDYSVRAPLTRPLTPLQAIAVYLMAHGYSYEAAAPLMSMTARTVKFHVIAAAKKMRGNMPVQMLVSCWYRGATQAVLDGDLLDWSCIAESRYP